MAKPLVGLVMGSDSDLDVALECIRLLKLFEVNFEVEVTSAHRSPEKTYKYAQTAAKRGLKVIIAAAGGSAHLAGVISAHTTLPVIGVPVPSSELKGIDSLLSTVQMPPGVAVATMGVGKSGASNAAILAVQILALSHKEFEEKLQDFKMELSKRVTEVSEKTREELKKLIKTL